MLGEPSADEAIISEFSTIIHQIDENVDLAKILKSSLPSWDNLVEFMKTHCKATCYSFQVKKCSLEECFYCTVIQPPRLSPEIFSKLCFLPDPMLDASKEHFRSFSEVYGKETSEKDRPSLNTDKLSSETDVINKSLLVGQKIRGVIHCTICKKPRCVYANTFLSNGQTTHVQRIRDEEIFVCGSSLFPESAKYHATIVVREALTCDSTVEISYYGAKMVKLPVICIHCGGSSNSPIAEDAIITELRKQFQRVRPICVVCKTNGKQPITWGPKNMAKKQRTL